MAGAVAAGSWIVVSATCLLVGFLRLPPPTPSGGSAADGLVSASPTVDWDSRWVRNRLAELVDRVQARAVTLKVQCLNIDAIDPDTVARFWAEALGWRRTYDSAEEVALEPPKHSIWDGVAPDLLFLRVPEPKAVKNRLHLDLRPDDQAAEVTRLEALGATRTDVGQSSNVGWIVMADPEGNEFCVLSPLNPNEQAEVDAIIANRESLPESP